jgi:hypothetical protein
MNATGRLDSSDGGLFAGPPGIMRDTGLAIRRHSLTT